jgi:hypothetical protein
MKRIRTLLCAAVLMLSAFAGLGATAPARACTGDPCDGICDTMRNLNQKLPPKLKLTDCGLG